MSVFSKISLGRPSNTYTHNLSFDNNTTFDFGSVQPTLVHYMEGNDKLLLNLKQFVRLAPLPAPTFGRVHLQNEFLFVPVTEVCPYYEALLANKPYYGGDNKSYTPEKVPYTTNQTLVQFLCLKYSSFNVLYRDSHESNHFYHYASNEIEGSALDPSDSTQLAQLDSILKGYWAGSYEKIGSLDTKNFIKLKYHSNEVPDGSFASGRIPTTLRPEPQDNDTYSPITIENADFVIDTGGRYKFLFRLNSAGRRLRKIFIGCGFSLSTDDIDPLSILSLLAFHKAYFDTYAPQRNISWISTNTYALIKFIEDHYFTDFYFFDLDDLTPLILFRQFLSDLSDCWYSNLDDFVSAHRENPFTQNSSLSLNVGHSGTQTLSNTYSSSVTSYPYVTPTSQKLNYLSIQGLQLLTRFISKDSVIGGKLSEWMKVHFGSDISNSLFKHTNRIGSSRLDVEINDVFSTSDTASDKGGEVLGAFAGKGIGYNDNKFTYVAPNIGFAILLSSIVPESGYFQGNDSHLYLIDRNTIPFPEYDALGYEVTPKSMIFDDRGTNLSSAFPHHGGFGFIPRYSSLKRKRNIVNGDMSRRGSVDTYNAYYLDRIIGPQEISSIPLSDGTVKLEIHKAQVPSASIEWRYPTKYSWLGNPNRIFYQSGTSYHGANFESEELIDDNFMCQMIFDLKVTNKYKPISQSFDTFDESVDDKSTDVKLD